MDNKDLPAMPLTGDAYSDLNGAPNQAGSIEDGMGLTKREYFAAKAMQGILASDTDDTIWDEVTILCSVKLSDMLLKELEKCQQQ